MNFLYNIGILTYSLLAHLASPFSERARLWTRGRRGWMEKISSVIKPSDRVFWIHCSSLGEFEQGRPVIEAVRKERPGMKILLTFFSPSGYEIRKNYPMPTAYATFRPILLRMPESSSILCIPMQLFL
jgi:3-deoxy-D-manno-octulosonic-acid transferase